MKKYQFLAERYYKFFKYLRTIGLISMIVFLAVSYTHLSKDFNS